MLSVWTAWAGVCNSERSKAESWPEHCVPRMYNLPQYIISLCLLGSRVKYSPLRFILINALSVTNTTLQAVSLTEGEKEMGWEAEREIWDGLWEQRWVGRQCWSRKKNLCISYSQDPNTDVQNQDRGIEVQYDNSVTWHYWVLKYWHFSLEYEIDTKFQLYIVYTFKYLGFLSSFCLSSALGLIQRLGLFKIHIFSKCCTRWWTKDHSQKSELPQCGL